MLERFSRAGALAAVALRRANYAGRNAVARWRWYRLGRAHSSHATCGGCLAGVIAPRPGSLDAPAGENLIQAMLLTAPEPVALQLAGWAAAARPLARAPPERRPGPLRAQSRAHP